jgi:hypothetical protein
MLEEDLDLCVVQLSSLTHLSDPEWRKLADGFLKTTRDYRLRFPRSGPGDRDLKKRAQKALDGIKKC